VQLRDGRKADLEKHVQDVNALLRRPNEDESQSDSAQGEDEQWDGIADPPPTNHEAEYVDDDRFTTVTVEAVDISRDGFHRVAEDADGEDVDGENGPERVKDSKSGQREDQEQVSCGKWKWTKERPVGSKKKKKKFRYESKAERKTTRYKEKSRNSKQARERKS